MKLNEYPLQNWDCKEITNRIKFNDIEILLLKINISQFTPREGLKNIVSIDKLDNILWIAEQPNYYFYSSYETLELKNGTLFALSGSYYCELDPYSGKIVKETFVK